MSVLLLLSLPPLTSCPSALFVCHPVDHATHEVPAVLTVFDLGHASSVERLYPAVGKHELQSSFL